ncbi:MAG: FHA domain-containing protein [Planctomycetes bacterium]|nr:FHA domain-containing protein [Planctomycetota bacterium]
MNGYLQLADGRTVPVRDGLLIGRVAGCDVVVDDAKASRRHARVVVEGGVVEIEDLGSSNGTLLNGNPVTRRVLRAGDTVQIGQSAIVYREGPAPGAAAAAAPAAAATFDDDDDLFAATATSTPAKAPPPPAVPAPAPPPSAPAAPPRAAAPPPPSPPPAAPARNVVEFEDEVVELRRAPEPPPRATGSAAAPSGGEPQVTAQSRILQYSKTGPGSGGLLGDDLAQLSGGTRSLLYAVVLLVAAAIVYGVIHLVR